MLAARCPFAEWHPFPRFPSDAFLDPVNRKCVWHKTQGFDGGLLETYAAGGGIPHFTIFRTGLILQHYDANDSSRALRNLRGGVETNRDGAVQVEIVGFAGEEVAPAQLVSIERLGAWLTLERHVEPMFPMGPLDGTAGKMTPEQWDNGRGHVGHDNVPENDHTDPRMTPTTFAALYRGVTGGTWERQLTPVEIEQKLYWDEGFVGKPITSRDYASLDEWMDGDHGPETKRAQAAYLAAQNVNPKPSDPIIEPTPPAPPVTFTVADVIELAESAATANKLAARLRAYANQT